MAACAHATIKLAFKEECHRFNVPWESLTVELLAVKARELYGLEKQDFTLAHRDHEGDMITISNAEELGELIREDISPTKSSLRLHIRLKDPAAQPPSLSIEGLGLDEPMSTDLISNVARGRFGKEFSEEEIINILRDISLFISTRDLGPDILSSVASEKSLITPQNATLIESKPRAQVVASKSDLDKCAKAGLPESHHSLVTAWSLAEVAEWISAQGYEEYAQAIQDNDITGDILVQLDDNNLKDLGIQSIGKRITLLKSIRKLKEQCVLDSLATRHSQGKLETPST
ncbi:hypothetical protein H4R33_005163 [Dimargaris cristalligena]|uniref:SAM domain-containing protein n=1 Tax=Dimargaris cristalligena TaxID=215637 RepID=A0A4P9ZTH0_9FUNG|nr:hypothetical protein H4R33_005163 [Dimargaris cristalligena]RKP36874.1 hypothetical protein BJ085DRAFT_33761 [Dimargaris cristalligena]|eukprot:RKP36874.1 hypothetical protein BJ085DRAFT_33761 [Dimargaris cristalligena]